MGRKEEIKKEDLVQAVVFADNFNTSFQPLTSSEPSCLLPLAGRPLIEYTLQSLSRSGVQDVVLYLTSNSSKVKDWLKGSEWSESYHAAPFSVTCITNEDCRSFGDGMRDLYEKGVLRNDFILVSGDLISNLNLAPYLNAHKENLAKDKHSIMSSIYIKGDQGHPLRGQGKELVLATDRSTQQLLFYQRSSRKSSNFPIQLFQHDEVEVMFDLLDPQIYICSPIVLALFSDNFDIQDMDTMISEILESELVDSTIYLQVLDSGFACRAENPYLYRKLFQKVLNRWAYPLVPERRNRSNQGDQICLQTKSVYKSSGGTVSRGTLLGKDTFIGNRVVLEECIKIHGSDLEEGVRVCKNTTISDSVLMKNCQVGENCVLVNCLVGENVIIPANCSIAEKVILGHGVELDLGASIPSGVRLSAEKRSDGFSDDETEGDEEKGEYGPKAHVYTDEEEEEEEDNDEEENCVEDKWGRIYESSSESDDDDEEEDGDGDWDDNDDEELEEEQDGIAEHHDVKNFRREVRESLLRGSKEGVITDNLVLEINSSKHAWNTTLCEVNQCVLECVLTLELDIDLPPAKLLQAVKVNISKFKQLLLKYSKSKSGQDYYLTAVEDILVRFPNLIEIIAKVLHLLYELDILGEDSILAWSENLQNTNLKKKIQPFLEWLEEDDSSDEESD